MHLHNEDVCFQRHLKKLIVQTWRMAHGKPSSSSALQKHSSQRKVMTYPILFFVSRHILTLSRLQLARAPLRYTCSPRKSPPLVHGSLEHPLQRWNTRHNLSLKHFLTTFFSHPLPQSEHIGKLPSSRKITISELVNFHQRYGSLNGKAAYTGD